MAKKKKTNDEKPTKPAAASKSVASSGGAKKVSKKAAHAAHWAPGNIHNATSDFLAETMEAMSVEYASSNICVAGEAGRLVIGIPLPSLAFEYLIQNDVYPLGRVAQIVGAEGSCKSAFAFEVVRWVRKHCGGLGALFENERKYSADYAMSILGHNDPRAMGLIECDDMEDWQSKIQSWLTLAKKRMTGTKENPGSGRIWPAVLILDSLTGSLSRDTVANIEKEGFAQRRFALEAMKITDFMKKMPADMQRWPFTLLVINHLKKKLNETGPAARPGADRHKPGGVHMAFQETFEFQLTRMAGRPKKLANWTELPINIELFKNSLGENRRNIDVNIKYWTEPNEETGEIQQQTVFDWHESTIDMLTTLETAGIKTAIKKIVDLSVTNTNEGKKVYSKALGISEKAALPFTDAGALLMQTPKVVEPLRDLFGIKRRKPFQPGVDYLEQLEMETDRIRQEIERAETIEIPKQAAKAKKLKEVEAQDYGEEVEAEVDMGSYDEE